MGEIGVAISEENGRVGRAVDERGSRRHTVAYIKGNSFLHCYPDAKRPRFTHLVILIMRADALISNQDGSSGWPKTESLSSSKSPSSSIMLVAELGARIHKAR